MLAPRPTTAATIGREVSIMKKTNVVHLLFCQFCGVSSRSKQAAESFIVGIVDRVCICSDCVGICNDVIAESRAAADERSAQPGTDPAVAGTD